MIATTQDNGAEMFPIVDEQGYIIDAATRAECHNGSKLLHPVVHLHVFNKDGDIYLQKRPEWKDIQPGRWDTAVGGHIDLGENVDQALHREVSEELGITFEEKAFYDVLLAIRDSHGFEYPEDKCKLLAKKIKALIDGSSVYADWLNNTNIRNRLAHDLTILLYENGYPPEWDQEVFEKILVQVENYKRNED